MNEALLDIVALERKRAQNRQVIPNLSGEDEQ